MTDLTTEVTVTIHGTEIELIAVGDEICPSRSRMLGIMRPYIEGCAFAFRGRNADPRRNCLKSYTCAG